MIGSSTITDSSRKRQKVSLGEVSPLSTSKRTNRFDDWMEGQESPRSRRSSRRTPQSGRSSGRRSPRWKDGASAKKGSFVRCLEEDISESVTVEVSPVSFYGGKRSRYLSPLERREALDEEEQRRKRLGMEEEAMTSPTATNVVKTPKSNVKKPSGGNRKMSSNSSSGKAVSRAQTYSSVQKTKSSEKGQGEDSTNTKTVATRTSPRKKSSPSPGTPKTKLFNKVTEDVTPLRRSPRKQPRKEASDDSDQNVERTGSFGNPRQKVLSAKKPAGVSKGIKLYMQTLNKNKKPVSKSGNKSSNRETAAAKTPKSDKERMPVSDKEATATHSNTKQDPAFEKSSNFFAEDDNDSPTELLNDSADSVEDTPPSQVKDGSPSPANGSAQLRSWDDDSTNKTPRKRGLEVTPVKSSSKRLKLSDAEVSQDDTEPDENSKKEIQSDKQTAAVKMFPIFTNLSTPPQSAKNKKTTTQSSTRSTRLQRKSPILKKSRDKDGREQMVLDLGQKRFGATTCTTCGMVYSMADPEDESDHIRFHNKFTECVKFPGWKKEQVIQEFHDGRIIMISADDPKYALKKVEDVRELVDTELGFMEGGKACKRDFKAFLFISNEKKVVGCCIVEKISKGYRVLTDNDQDYSEDSVDDQKRAWCCSNEAEDVVCGISRVWVWGQMRRKKIATRLMDCLKCNFTYGCTLSNDDIAFSDPTPDGKTFATKYTGTAKFLVYNFTINSQ